MKAVIFTRVSTQKQAQEGYSVDSQIQKLQDYCKEHNFDVIKEFQLTSNNEFLDLIDFIKNQNETIALVMYSINRLYRSFKESIAIDELMKNEKIEIHFFKERQTINKHSSSNDILQWDINVSFAKKYINSLPDRIKNVLQCKLQNGEWISKAPFGYKNITLEGRKKDIAIDEDSSLIVKEIFNLYSTGNYTISKLAEKFNLSKFIISAILKNPFYYGEMKVKDKLYPHRYKAIISKELFDKCQK